MNARCRYCTTIVAVVTLCLAMAACREGQPEAARVTPDTSQSADSSSGAASDVTTHRPASNSNGIAPVGARNFMALMQELNAPERTSARAWYRRIGGPLMARATPAQMAWMQARHYPMPADIARAASMSKAELKSAANTGDSTAQILYMARLLDAYNRHYGSINGPSDPARYRDPNRRRLLHEINRSMPGILASGSPYGGYLYAARQRLMYPGEDTTNVAVQLAGLVWASKFGDTRANALLNTPTIQAVDAATAATAINGMLITASYANPTLFSTTVVPMPPSHP